MAEEKRQEGGHGHGIGCMAGEEAVFASTVGVDHIDGIRDEGVVRRAETRHQRFADGGGHLVGQQAQMPLP